MTGKTVYAPGEGYDPDPKPCTWPPEQRCKARRKRTNFRCTQPRMQDQTTCRLHGGASPQARSAAARRGVEREAHAVLARLDVLPISDPLTELSTLAGQVVAWKDVLAAKVNALTELRYETETGGEQLRAEVALWERALDRCNTVLGTIARLNIDDRLARISEQQAAAMMRALDAALAKAGITGAAAIEPRRAAAAELRLVK